MRCKKAKKLISDYIDGELDSSKRSSLEKHVEECEECQKFMEDYKSIARTAQELEAGSPSPYVWTRIKQGVEAQTPSYETSGKRVWRWSPQLKYAVGVLSLLVVVGAVVIGITYFQNQKGVSSFGTQGEVIANLKQAEKHYKKAIESMMKAAEAQENGMDPEVAKVFQANLELIDSSISACQQAVFSDPQDIESRNILLAAYKEKADLLYKLLYVKDYSPKKGESETKI
ncbi:MAG TPA: zf-HC2 domain-containing protein [Acidobacteriota bacterium]|nr:zf-HC2 domain-containing protein [Acidobacteriota bacterium]